MLNQEGNGMVVLDGQQLELVSGGRRRNYGTGARGLFSVRNVAAAGRLVTGFSYIGAAFTFGYGIGTLGYRGYNNIRYSRRK